MFHMIKKAELVFKSVYMHLHVIHHMIILDHAYQILSKLTICLNHYICLHDLGIAFVSKIFRPF